jgi:hypothetical protein
MGGDVARNMPKGFGTEIVLVLVVVLVLDCFVKRETTPPC